MINIPEKDIKRQVLDYLDATRIFYHRNNTGAFKNDKGGFFKFGAVGSPDIICVIKGTYLGIELKGTGGTQSEEQKKFQTRLEAAGGKYILARSSEDVEEAIRQIKK